MSQNFYRYELVSYSTSSSDDSGHYSYSVPIVNLKLKEFNLHKETAKGYWIGYGNPTTLKGQSRWISKTSKKRYAYPSKLEALVNFVKRSEVRSKILTRQLDDCKYGLRLAKELV